MIKVVSVKNMRQIEAAADKSGISYDIMMQNAGRAVADRALEILNGLDNARVTILVGPGNNGGDGLVAGHFIAQDSDAEVRFYLLKPRDEKQDANFKAVIEAGLFIAQSEDDRDHRVIRNLVSSADLVIDALFGIGVRLPLKDDALTVVRNVNQALNEPPLIAPVKSTITPTSPRQMKRTAVPYVLAVDCPTGLDCDTGELDSNAIFANETVTFIAAKPGLFMFPGAGAVGKLSVAPIGIPEDLKELKKEKNFVVDSETARTMLPNRPQNSHKGTFGKALIAAGSINYSGAPGLAAEAAYRVGAGLVTIGAPHPVITSLAAKLNEVTWLLLPHDMGVISDQAVKIIREEIGSYDTLLLGPGWGREDTTREFLFNLLNQPEDAARSRSKRRIGFIADSAETTQTDTPAENALPPLVIDADGLNLLSEDENWWTHLPKNTIITPHPMEMARLSKLETSEIQTNRWEIARAKAKEWGVVLVLKGAHTIIAAPDGQEAVLPFKTDALATAGTGDVLAGMIAGFLAQGLEPFNAACLAGYLHGLAAIIAASDLGSRSVIAGDTIRSLATAIKQVETG